MRFLSHLLDILFPLRDTARLVQEATLESVMSLAHTQHHHRDRYTITTLLPYRDPVVRALIIETKFRDNRKAAALLAEVLAAHIRATYAASLAVIPLPLSQARRKARGYNQVERVARIALTDVASVTLLSTALARTRDTRPQTELTESSRKENVQQAFHANAMDPLPHYLLIDDVMTTGATIHDAVRALTKSGARHIDVLALAH